MSNWIGTDSTGNPVVTIGTDELPEVSPPGAPWMLIGGSGGGHRPEYRFATGEIDGNAADGLTWRAVIPSAGAKPTEVVVTAGWQVTASLFSRDGEPLQALGCRLLDSQRWEIESPTFEAGAKRLYIVAVTATAPGKITSIRTAWLVLVAGTTNTP